jgi:hypothetical protein
MGASESKQKILNEVITESTMDVMAKNSTNIGASVDNEFNLDISGEVRGSTIESTASISINALSKSEVNMKMTDDLSTKLKSELDKKRSDFPEFGKKDDQEIDNIIRNNVSASLSAESLINANMSVAQRVNIKISGKLIDSKIIITSKGTMALVNGMANAIIKDLGVKNETESKGKQVTTSFIGDTITAFTDGITGFATGVGNLFGFSPNMVILFIVIVLAGVYLKLKQPQLGAGLGKSFNRSFNRSFRPGMPPPPGRPGMPPPPGQFRPPPGQFRQF